ncbi:hypothetical protein LTR95_006194 [Oleoguttula sp. CCFEE 5521]
MRLLIRAAVLLTCCTSLVAGWTKDDHEIFRLNDEVRKNEGLNTTFYSLLGVPSTANNKDIERAYRKLSVRLHPDKAKDAWLASRSLPKSTKTKPGTKPTVHVQKNKQPSNSEYAAFMKTASARYERINSVVLVLKGSERQRYDHFLSNGFPAWRGTGYYYSRYRPGLGSVLVGLFLFLGGGVHYAVRYMNYKQHREFVQRYIKDARRNAWGDDSSLANIPGLNGNTTPTSASRQDTPDGGDESMQWNRKQKRAMEKDKKRDAKNPTKSARLAEKAKKDGISTPVEAELTSGPVGAKKRVRAENGKILIVDSVGNVYLEDETEEGETREFLLDPDEIAFPSITDTFVVRGPMYLYNISLGRLLNKQTNDYIFAEANGEDVLEEVGIPGITEPSLSSAITPNAEAESRKRKLKRYT